MIHLTPLPDDVPASVRLRRALKLLLRGFGFRCTEVRNPRPGEASASPGADDTPS